MALVQFCCAASCWLWLRFGQHARHLPRWSQRRRLHPRQHKPFYVGWPDNYANVDVIVGEHAVTGDPLFVNLPAGQFNLGEGSPAINQGDPAQAYADPDGTANDIGAFDAASAHTIWWKTDFPPALGSKQE